MEALREEGGLLLKTKAEEHGLVPEVRSLDGGEGVHHAEGQNALDWTRYKAQSQGLGVVLIPGLNVEGQESWLPSDG